jgi:hypothetical protein
MLFLAHAFFLSYSTFPILGGSPTGTGGKYNYMGSKQNKKRVKYATRQWLRRSPITAYQ